MTSSNIQKVTILGSTGSIGMQTLDVVALQPERFVVYALTAYSQVDRLYTQCLRFQPAIAVMVDAQAAAQLRQRLQAVGSNTEVVSGQPALETLAGDKQADIIVAAIVGAVGLLPTLAAVKAGKRVLLANKEALVMSGELLMQAVRDSDATLLPVDSEHNAVFQAFPQDYCPGQPLPAGVSSIILTASGGPFLTMDLGALKNVTPEQAIAHPNWSMGPKISVDSATMLNKALEVIEAYWLFGIEGKDIEVLIHPQSVVHSLVRYQDGSVLAQLGVPDMRTPIASALAWPGRMISGAASLDLVEQGRLDFEPVCKKRFPCLGLAYQALEAGGTAMCLLNAANEVAVEAFLSQKIGFLDIAHVVHEVLDQVVITSADDLDAIMIADAKAREMANKLIKTEISHLTS